MRITDYRENLRSVFNCSVFLLLFFVLFFESVLWDTPFVCFDLYHNGQWSFAGPFGCLTNCGVQSPLTVSVNHTSPLSNCSIFVRTKSTTPSVGGRCLARSICKENLDWKLSLSSAIFEQLERRRQVSPVCCNVGMPNATPIESARKAQWRQRDLPYPHPHAENIRIHERNNR